MDDGALAELRALQARAYGPGADIQDDDVALRRLIELQALERTGTRPDEDSSGSEDRPSEKTPPAVALVEAGEEHAPDDGAGDDSGKASVAASVPPAATIVTPAEGRRRLGRKRIAMLWATSLVAVALVVAAVTAFTVPRTSTASGVRHVGSMTQDPDFEWPDFFGPEEPGAQGFTDFYGMTAMTGNRLFGAEAADTCMLLVPTEQINRDAASLTGPILNGCGAGVFRATVQLIVQGDLPPQLLERFPQGTALQFVLDGDRVDVYSDAP